MWRAPTMHWGPPPPNTHTKGTFMRKETHFISVQWVQGWRFSNKLCSLGNCGNWKLCVMSNQPYLGTAKLLQNLNIWPNNFCFNFFSYIFLHPSLMYFVCPSDKFPLTQQVNFFYEWSFFVRSCFKGSKVCWTLGLNSSFVLQQIVLCLHWGDWVGICYWLNYHYR